MSDFTARMKFPDGKAIEFHGPADITKETTDAIVNAANSHLAGGGGVDGAIHRAGGPSILEECQRIIGKIGRLPTGKAAMTHGGRLQAKYVIHAVGPRYRDGRSGEPQALASCHEECLRLADENELASISFPAISTGIYGYPVKEAAEVAVKTVTNALPGTSAVRHVRFILYDRGTCDVYVAAAESMATKNSIDFEKGPS